MPYSLWVSQFSVLLPVPWFTSALSQEDHVSQCFTILFPSLPLLVQHLAPFLEFLTYHIHQAGSPPAHCQVLSLGCDASLPFGACLHSHKLFLLWCIFHFSCLLNLGFGPIFKLPSITTSNLSHHTNHLWLQSKKHSSILML